LYVLFVFIRRLPQIFRMIICGSLADLNVSLAAVIHSAVVSFYMKVVVRRQPIRDVALRS